MFVDPPFLQIPQESPSFTSTTPDLSPIDSDLFAGKDTFTTQVTYTDVDAPAAPRLTSTILPHEPLPERASVALKKTAIANKNGERMAVSQYPPIQEEDMAIVNETSRSVVSTGSRLRKTRPSRGSHSVVSPVEDRSQVRTEIMQTITCTPGYRSYSLEELRIDAYAQAHVAGNSRPWPVQEGDPSWRVLPPVYAPFVHTISEDDEGLGLEVNPTREVAMSDLPNLSGAFTFEVSPTLIRRW
ncbi:unnamed protein product [Somion occarium]|uniref:Uncharacterized protein n=1 Tax=Somion occarium TaxID=3059160 RepID=A0ABP1DUM7_9APHY